MREYYYRVNKDNIVLSVPDWKTIQEATVYSDKPIIFNLNFVDADEEEKNIPVKFFPNDTFEDGKYETEAPSTITYDLKGNCLEILENFLDDECNYYRADVKLYGKHYRATLESPEEFPDQEYYCHHCGAVIGLNEEIGSLHRCERCGFMNKIDYKEDE